MAVTFLRNGDSAGGQPASRGGSVHARQVAHCQSKLNGEALHMKVGMPHARASQSYLMSPRPSRQAVSSRHAHGPAKPPPSNVNLFCGSCGSKVIKGVRFCSACGLSVQPTDLPPGEGGDPYGGRAVRAPIDKRRMGCFERRPRSAAGQPSVSSPRFQLGSARLQSWSQLPVRGESDHPRATMPLAQRQVVPSQGHAAATRSPAGLDDDDATTMGPLQDGPLSEVHTSAQMLIRMVQDSELARKECCQACDETFKDLERAYMETDEARLAARALVVKSTRASARFRAAVERLEAEAMEHVATLDIERRVEALYQGANLESGASVETLALEVGRLEGALESTTAAFNQELRGQKREMEARIEGLLGELVALEERSLAERRASAAGHVAELRAATELLDASRQEVAELERAVSEARRSNAESLRACREHCAAEVRALKATHAAEMNECHSLAATERRRRQDAEETREALHSQLVTETSVAAAKQSALEAVQRDARRELRDEARRAKVELEEQLMRHVTETARLSHEKEAMHSQMVSAPYNSPRRPPNSAPPNSAPK